MVINSSFCAEPRAGRQRGEGRQDDGGGEWRETGMGGVSGEGKGDGERGGARKRGGEGRGMGRKTWGEGIISTVCAEPLLSLQGEGKY